MTEVPDQSYRDILEQMHDSYFEVDLEGKFTFVNRSTCRNLGYSREELIGKNYSFLVPDDEKKAMFTAFNQVFKSGEPDNGYAHRIINSSGSILFAESSIDVRRNMQGEVIGFKSVSRDVTARKQVEAALKKSEEQYRLLTENIKDVVWVLDTETMYFRYVSPSVQRLRGYTPEEILAEPMTHALSPEARDHITALTQRRAMDLLSGNEPPGKYYTNEVEQPCKGGCTVWTEVITSFYVNQENGRVEVLGITRDITERKQAEQALRESEEKYRMLVLNAQEAIYVAVDGMLKFGNNRAAELSGYTAEELTTRPFVEFIHPDDREMVISRYMRRMQGEDIPNLYTFRIIDKAGNIRWVELTAALITWDGKAATLNFLTDVTDRKRLEEERQRLAKLESVGLLAGGIAHDFNNILTAILGNISLAKSEAADGSELQKGLEQAEKASLRARDLTVQLLTFSKGGAPVKKLSSLTELVKDTARFALRGSNVNCSFVMPGDLWHAEIDAGQVSQVIHNLVINAQQAMPEGGTVGIRADNLALSESQSIGKGLPLKAGDYVRIAVVDHGVGISPEHLEKIFDPFFSTRQAGSGLGLATSYSIARNHGGHISVESSPGAGSTFYLYLPASLATEGLKHDRTDVIKPVEKVRILVMDDEKGVREVAGRMLRHIGYGETVFASDGAEAVRLYQAAMQSGSPFNVVILDLTVAGGMGGEAAVRQLLEIDPGVRAIVSSGYAEDPVIAKYREFGFSGMVAKPYTLEELGRALHDVIG